MPKGIINVQANQVTLKKITFKPETSSKPLKIALMHHKLSHEAYHVKIVSFASWRWIFLIAHTFISSHTFKPKKTKIPFKFEKTPKPFPFLTLQPFFFLQHSFAQPALANTELSSFVLRRSSASPSLV